MEVVVGNSFCSLDGYLHTDVGKDIANKLSYVEKSDYMRRLKVQQMYGYMPPEKVNYVYDYERQKFPTGMLSTVVDILKSHGVEYTIKDIRVKPEKYLFVEWKSKYTLREYQQQAVDVFLKAGRGRLKVSTGGGKSLIYCKIAHELGVKTLVVCSTREGMNDMYSQSKWCFSESLLGRVGDGYKKYGEFMTITTMSSFKLMSQEIKDQFDFLIVDEFHKAGSKGVSESIYSMDKCYYKLGASGTQFRSDGADILLQAVAGRILFDVNTKGLQESGTLMNATINFVRSGSPYISSKQFSDFHELYAEAITRNERRNSLVFDLVKKHLGKQMLVLSSSIEHGNILLEGIKKYDPDAIYLSGTSKKKVRKEGKDDFKNKKLKTIVASKIWDESVDVPCLEVVIIASAGKSGISTIQRLGRVVRKSEGKESAILYDFYDGHNDKLERQTLERIKHLRREGHKIHIIEESEI